jgi:D-2-hydroxyacid dehydrogenase (NADP+)
MPDTLPNPLNVVLMSRLSDAAIERIRGVAPGRVNVIAAGNDFGDEEVWPPDRVRRGTPPNREGLMTTEEREALWASAHVMYLILPFPIAMARKAENLLWSHFGFAGVSNLRGSDFWDPPFIVTSTRGRNQALPIAETTVAAALMFTKKLDVAVRESDQHRFEGSAFAGMRLVAGKTMAIVGLGGIGGHVAELARGVGMRVVATRRSAKERTRNVDGCDVLFPPGELHEMLAEADFVAVCAMLTDETEGLINKDAFDAMKPGAYLINTARGEIVDEDALADALESGRLGGAYLDVWANDMVLGPSERLQSVPNIVFTPHVSGRSDSVQGFSIDIFCENLQRLLEGRELLNVVDWSRGY